MTAVRLFMSNLRSLRHELPSTKPAHPVYTDASVQVPSGLVTNVTGKAWWLSMRDTVIGVVEMPVWPVGWWE